MNILNKRMAVVLIILLFLGSSVVPIMMGTSETQTSSDDDLFFDLFINRIMKTNRMPSLSACIIKNNSVVWAKSYGLADVENNKPATVDTIYMIGSTAKTITATALMQLYEQGKFDLDDDVNDYLDFGVKNPNHLYDPITFRMLLAHQSSLRDRPYLTIKKYPGDPDILRDLYTWLKEIVVPGGANYTDSVWSLDAPSEKFYYSNIGYAIIGYLVEIISGERFDDYCKTHIFEPLGMYNTSFRLSDLDIDKIAVPYALSSKIVRLGKLVPFEHYGTAGYPCGGSARSSVMDLSPFIIAHMNGGEYNGVRILNEETVELMHTVQYPDSRFTNDFKFYQYGLGWEISKNICGEEIIGHTGHTTTSSSRIRIRTSDDVSIIYFINRCVNKRIRGAMAEHMIEYALFKKADKL